ncbi:TPR-like protein [Suillus ampliporus]|nr:TPR-like protein [Suillus ampliporus]
MADSVEQSRAALQQRPPGHPDHSGFLDNLASCLQDRFKQQGDLSDLDEAIQLHRTALELRPPGHIDRFVSLNNLAISLRDRFLQQGVLSELDEAIGLNRAALALRPPNHPDRSLSLNNLAISLQTRFQRQGILSSLDEAIELHRDALALRPLDHPDRFFSLNNLAISLQDRFKQQGVLSDLSEAIGLHRVALTLCPPGHVHRFITLNNLAITLRDRSQQQGVVSDLDEAIELHRAAVVLRPSGHSDRCMSLNNLAISLQDRFQRQGNLSDLGEAIEFHRAALADFPLGHAHRSSSHNNLGFSLQVRFQQQGNLSDLDEAIENHEAALVLRPPGHPHRSSSLHNLSICLRVRFHQRGILSDLDKAIESHRAALALFPPGHSNRPLSIQNLASSLRIRFEQQGIQSDLDEAIELHRVAVTLFPPDHFHRPSCLNGLARSLRDRFQQLGVLPDLDEAIELHRAALALCTLGHCDRYSSLSGLAVSLRNRFEQRGIQSDLDEAIEFHRAALELCPSGHSDRPSCLNNLAMSLRDRFKQRSVLSDLNEAIELHRASLELYPPDHSHRSLSLDNLVISLQIRFQQQGLSSDSDEIFEVYLHLSRISHPASRGDLRAAKSWAAYAEELKHDSVMIAYQTALKFLDQHVAILSSSSRHFDAVRGATSSLAMDAFSCSVRRGALKTAVELVEQGRAVFWTQLARFRTPLDDLMASGGTEKALAEEFKQLSFRLRNTLDASPEDQSPQIRQLTLQWDDVISRLRELPDFSRFLLPPLFPDLQKAAEDGPVIIVNASRYSCDALIILSNQDPVHIPLDIARAEVSELASEFQSLTAPVGSSDQQVESNKMVGVLRKLWDGVVGPIVQALRVGKFTPRGSRIWWCPTAEFTLLPLHAAGPYTPNSHSFSHFYISSYTPTLAALIRARRQVPRDASDEHFVAIGQGNPQGGSALRSVAAELAAVAQRVTPVLSFASLADIDATIQGASDALSQNQWLHLACHGMPNRKQPFESSFAMRDGPLKIREIIRSHLQSPEFAFLSACHTTVGDESSPDEAIHLAAAMQFSGFRSVIGSMWSVDDSVAGQVVSAFYDNFVDDSGGLDCKHAAGALHKAVKKLRKKIPFEQQIVFVHIGV